MSEPKLTRRDLKALRMALYIAADSERALADAYRTRLVSRGGHIVSVVPKDGRPIARRALANAARFRALAKKLGSQS